MIFKKRMCNHTYAVKSKSNVLQLDCMGYPLRLCICECEKCGDSSQEWIDVEVEALKELDTGKSVLLEWEF